MTPLPTVTIATLPQAAFGPVLGTDGDRVVLAYYEGRRKSPAST